MKITQNHDLTTFNTFGVHAQAKFFTQIENEADIKELFTSPEFTKNPKLFLGGGSNILITRDFDGIVILNKLKGIEISGDNQNSVLLKVASGEVWHDLITFAVDRDYWGIENLSFIPGSVGAAPVQNIGAYGAELKDVLENVEGLEIDTGKKKIFTAKECEFGYRDSIFKNSLKHKYFILSITIRLGKVENKNINYKILQEYLKKNNIVVKKSKDISDAVAEIRRSKLPDPKVIGNAGSFFKNVFVDEEKKAELLKAYPEMPFFEEAGVIKIPAGWLIESAGWKGKRVGNTGVHDKQALVLVNYGGATGEEIKDLSKLIIASVYSKFRLKLVPEVNLI